MCRENVTLVLPNRALDDLVDALFRDLEEDESASEVPLQQQQQQVAREEVSIEDMQQQQQWQPPPLEVARPLNVFSPDEWPDYMKVCTICLSLLLWSAGAQYVTGNTLFVGVIMCTVLGTWAAAYTLMFQWYKDVVLGRYWEFGLCTCLVASESAVLFTYAGLLYRKVLEMVLEDNLIAAAALGAVAIVQMVLLWVFATSPDMLLPREDVPLFPVVDRAGRFQIRIASITYFGVSVVYMNTSIGIYLERSPECVEILRISVDDGTFFGENAGAFVFYYRELFHCAALMTRQSLILCAAMHLFIFCKQAYLASI